MCSTRMAVGRWLLRLLPVAVAMAVPAWGAAAQQSETGNVGAAPQSGAALTSTRASRRKSMSTGDAGICRSA